MPSIGPFRTLALAFLLVLPGCKDDKGSSGDPLAPAADNVIPVCESISFSVQSGALIGARECSDSFNYADDESCEFEPVSQSYSGSCSESNPDCGVAIETSAAGSLEFLPEFDGTGNLVAIRASGSVSAQFSGSLQGSCGQIGHVEFSRLTISITFDVVDEPVTAELSGTLGLDSTGGSRPLFILIADDDFELRFPETGLTIGESWEYQPGTHTVELSLRANPEFGSGPSSGDFSLVLRFRS